MTVNILRDLMAYVRALIEQLPWWSPKSLTIDRIYKYHAVSIGLHTSGQPTPEQFQAVKDAGTVLVINLAPATAENALDNEAEIVQGLAMRYVHIPVDFAAPSEQNFEKFCELMSTQELGSLWVHCAANKRVSAFVYRYRCEVLGHPSKQALKELYTIWEPLGVWHDFIKAL